MSHWRIAVVFALLVIPFAALAGVGSYALWERGWGFYAWWPLAGCMALGYALGWYWQHRRQLLRPPDFAPPMHWTERDAQAWKLVEVRAQAVARLPADKLTEVPHYLSTAQGMAVELAQFYHPGATDPVGNLTVPEVLAVIELAAHDLAVLVDRHLPGGHLLTINDWKRARQLSEWYQSASNLWWIISALFNPAETGARYAASRIGVGQPMQMLQQNLLAWFYTAYIHRLGTYLIELNSGRLRVGATRYRQLVEGLTRPGGGEKAGRQEDEGGAEGADEAVDWVRQVTVTVLGQVKAGKSSLVNALLGQQRAQTDVLPATSGIERYQLQPRGIPTRLVLLDTVGYAHAGPRADQLASTREAARQSDLLLLVLHARNPARQADLQQLEDLRNWFASQPDLRRPPVLAVVTHVDLLSPALEWSPPYDWARPTRPKEVSIRDAVGAVRTQLGAHLAAVVPACAAPGKVYGVEEWLLPAVAELLDEVHGVALLRCLRAEVNKDKVRKVFRQLLATGKEAARIAWQSLQQGAGGRGGERK
jgi:predicted GTPase